MAERVPYGRLRNGTRFVGLTPALLRALRTHGPQQLTRATAGDLVLVVGRSAAAIAARLEALGCTWEEEPS